MCGIIGYCTYEPNVAHLQALKLLLFESKIRGLHAFGITHSQVNVDNIDDVILITKKFYRLDDLIAYIESVYPFYDAILHTRYSTSGDWEVLENNQPIVVNNYSLVFNGVISMKTKQEMEKEYDVSLKTDNDGELFIRSILAGSNPEQFVTNITGSFAGLWYDPMCDDIVGKIFAIRNSRRPLWIVNYDADTVFVASTKDIVMRALGNIIVKQCVAGIVYDLEKCI
jgi:glutamine phosphoribosylpyrophosphate amidotransferase